MSLPREEGRRKEDERVISSPQILVQYICFKIRVQKPSNFHLRCWMLPPAFNHPPWHSPSNVRPLFASIPYSTFLNWRPNSPTLSTIANSCHLRGEVPQLITIISSSRVVWLLEKAGGPPLNSPRNRGATMRCAEKIARRWIWEHVERSKEDERVSFPGDLAIPQSLMPVARWLATREYAGIWLPRCCWQAVRRLDSWATVCCPSLLRQHLNNVAYLGTRFRL